MYIGKANCSRAMGKPEVVFALSLEMTGGLQQRPSYGRARVETEGWVNVREPWNILTLVARTPEEGAGGGLNGWENIPGEKEGSGINALANHLALAMRSVYRKVLMSWFNICPALFCILCERIQEKKKWLLLLPSRLIAWQNNSKRAHLGAFEHREASKQGERVKSNRPMAFSLTVSLISSPFLCWSIRWWLIPGKCFIEEKWRGMQECIVCCPTVFNMCLVFPYG